MLQLIDIFGYFLFYDFAKLLTWSYLVSFILLDPDTF